MRAAVVDIETTALEACGSGWMLCAVLKELGEDAKIYRYDQYHCPLGNETRMLVAFVKELEQYDLVIGHNVEAFDIPYIKSRLIRCKLPPITSHPFIYDTKCGFKRCKFRTVDNGFGKPTTALDMTIDFFGIPQRKTKIYPVAHWQTV